MAIKEPDYDIEQKKTGDILGKLWKMKVVLECLGPSFLWTLIICCDLAVPRNVNLCETPSRDSIPVFFNFVRSDLNYTHNARLRREIVAHGRSEPFISEIYSSGFFSIFHFTYVPCITVVSSVFSTSDQLSTNYSVCRSYRHFCVPWYSW